ncbi:nucleoside-diphosphate kinase [uncultured Clostridium sp.]|jgi:nucleoside-diphosphate kinase|uniref:nucleoside-diphosphate kinase n=1 Tax=uncultured Clostridium sp. TaxID=59620 RepID=UPI00260A5D1E|nr:nucleoside-diphosphate kinase [uncultured Clostridium sp.]
MNEKCLVLIKPDAVERNLIGNILAMYEENDLIITAIKMEQVSKEKATTHYAEHIGRGYFDELIKYITRSPLTAIVLSGENAISKVRALNGATKNPDEGTIRAKYGLSITENSVHASDSIDNAKREISIWFE